MKENRIVFVDYRQAGLPGKMIETPMLEWSWEFCTPNVLCATITTKIISLVPGSKWIVS